MIRVRTQDADLTDAVNGLRFSNVDPGGFESASFDVPAYLAPSRGDSLFIDDEFGMIWQGRVDENDVAVGDNGDRRLVTAYGDGILLKRQTVLMIFVDRSFASWGEQTLPRRTYLVNAGQDLEQISWASGGGALSCGLPLSALPAATRSSGGFYAAPSGAKVAKVQYKGTTGTLPAGWSANFESGDDDSIALTSAAATLNGSLQTLTPAAARRYIEVYFIASGAATPTDPEGLVITRIAAFGNHGLTTRTISGEPDGLYGGDVINYLIGLASGINAGTIDAPTDYVIPHLWAGQRISIEDYIAEVNKHFGYSWGVWDSGNLFETTPRFNWTARDTEAKWKIRRSEADISLAATLAEMANTIYVRYTDPSGRAQELTDTADVRALTDAGLDQEGFTDAGLQVESGAQRFADIFFSLQGQDPPLTGTIDIEGDVALAAGGELPAHHMRADGSLIRVEDLLPISEVYDLSDLRQTLLPIKRVEVDASGQTPRTSISVDQTQDVISVLQARMATEDVAQNF